MGGWGGWCCCSSQQQPSVDSTKGLPQATPSPSSNKNLSASNFQLEPESHSAESNQLAVQQYSQANRQDSCINASTQEAHQVQSVQGPRPVAERPVCSTEPENPKPQVKPHIPAILSSTPLSVNREQERPPTSLLNTLSLHDGVLEAVLTSHNPTYRSTSSSFSEKAVSLGEHSLSTAQLVRLTDVYNSHMSGLSPSPSVPGRDTPSAPGRDTPSDRAARQHGLLNELLVISHNYNILAAADMDALSPASPSTPPRTATPFPHPVPPPTRALGAIPLITTTQYDSLPPPSDSPTTLSNPSQQIGAPSPSNMGPPETPAEISHLQYLAKKAYHQRQISAVTDWYSCHSQSTENTPSLVASGSHAASTLEHTVASQSTGRQSYAMFSSTLSGVSPNPRSQDEVTIGTLSLSDLLQRTSKRPRVTSSAVPMKVAGRLLMVNNPLNSTMTTSSSAGRGVFDQQREGVRGVVPTIVVHSQTSSEAGSMLCMTSESDVVVVEADDDDDDEEDGEAGVDRVCESSLAAGASSSRVDGVGTRAVGGHAGSEHSKVANRHVVLPGEFADAVGRHVSGAVEHAGMASLHVDTTGGRMGPSLGRVVGPRGHGGLMGGLGSHVLGVRAHAVGVVTHVGGPKTHLSAGAADLVGPSRHVVGGKSDGRRSVEHLDVLVGSEMSPLGGIGGYSSGHVRAFSTGTSPGPAGCEVQRPLAPAGIRPKVTIAVQVDMEDSSDDEDEEEELLPLSFGQQRKALESPSAHYVVLAPQDTTPLITRRSNPITGLHPHTPAQPPPHAALYSTSPRLGQHVQSPAESLLGGSYVGGGSQAGEESCGGGGSHVGGDPTMGASSRVGAGGSHVGGGSHLGGGSHTGGGSHVGGGSHLGGGSHMGGGSHVGGGSHLGGGSHVGAGSHVGGGSHVGVSRPRHPVALSSWGSAPMPEAGQRAVQGNRRKGDVEVVSLEPMSAPRRATYGGGESTVRRHPMPTPTPTRQQQIALLSKQVLQQQQLSKQQAQLQHMRKQARPREGAQQGQVKEVRKAGIPQQQGQQLQRGRKDLTLRPKQSLSRSSSSKPSSSGTPSPDLQPLDSGPVFPTPPVQDETPRAGRFRTEHRVPPSTRNSIRSRQVDSSSPTGSQRPTSTVKSASQQPQVVESAPRNTRASNSDERANRGRCSNAQRDLRVSRYGSGGQQDKLPWSSCKASKQKPDAAGQQVRKPVRLAADLAGAKAPPRSLGAPEKPRAIAASPIYHTHKSSDIQALERQIEMLAFDIQRSGREIELGKRDGEYGTWEQQEQELAGEEAQQKREEGQCKTRSQDHVAEQAKQMCPSTERQQRPGKVHKSGYEEAKLVRTNTEPQVRAVRAPEYPPDDVRFQGPSTERWSRASNGHEHAPGDLAHRRAGAERQPRVRRAPEHRAQGSKHRRTSSEQQARHIGESELGSRALRGIQPGQYEIKAGMQVCRSGWNGLREVEYRRQQDCVLEQMAKLVDSDESDQQLLGAALLSDALGKRAAPDISAKGISALDSMLGRSEAEDGRTKYVGPAAAGWQRQQHADNRAEQVSEPNRDDWWATTERVEEDVMSSGGFESVKNHVLVTSHSRTPSASSGASVSFGPTNWTYVGL